MPDVVDDIQLRLITEQLLTRLRTLTAVEVYDAEVPAHPPALAGDDEGRVGPYVVAYPSAGTPTSETDLADSSDDLVYTFQLTCAAGYRADCEYLIDRVRPLMRSWAPVLDGVNFGLVRPPVGYDPGPIRRDQDVTPPRFYVPLQYRTTATT